MMRVHCTPFDWDLRPPLSITYLPLLSPAQLRCPPALTPFRCAPPVMARLRHFPSSGPPAASRFLLPRPRFCPAFFGHALPPLLPWAVPLSLPLPVAAGFQRSLHATRLRPRLGRSSLHAKSFFWSAPAYRVGLFFPFRWLCSARPSALVFRRISPALL